MATRSYIGKRLEDGTVRFIYCHYDGYANGVGSGLATFYETEEKVDKLLALGDISALGQFVEPVNPNEHSFDNPQDDVTIAYGRDRGEEKREARVVPRKRFEKMNENLFLFENGKWWFSEGTFFGSEFFHSPWYELKPMV